MKEVIGLILMLVGVLTLGLCGLGITVSLLAWLLSLMGIPFITGAGLLIFKFAGFLIVGLMVAVTGQALIS